jgi:hypothetical protein
MEEFRRVPIWTINWYVRFGKSDLLNIVNDDFNDEYYISDWLESCKDHKYDNNITLALNIYPSRSIEYNPGLSVRFFVDIQVWSFMVFLIELDLLLYLTE